MIRIGYACINLSCNLSSNRGMIRKTFLDRGINYCSKIALDNVKTLEKIIRWNKENDIYVYRMSSDIFPWMSEYNISDLPDYKEISSILYRIGEYAKNNNQRLSFHPGQFNQLASKTERVISNTIKELNQHSEIMDLMGLPNNNLAKINIHIGAAFGDKKSSMERWINNFHKLDNNTRKRLVVENDDKPNMYTPYDLYYGIYEKIGIPITFDYLHYYCNPGNQTEEESLKLCLSTWKCRPCVHYSSSRKIYEDSNSKYLAHADYIYENINTYGNNDIDIIFEAKAKDLSVLKYKKDMKDKN